ncbi:DUF5658 family protein [Clostridium gasigenes]|uniref:DUF5658 family protein n=1 Tax=Clostridium gasigenes TaxID=94869 RepID=UPI001C0BF485|nr:DUF5658 family protein [Clostridium gasigenes]MBU3106276.1 hypothetical protein [Clostridium gasigenes]
MVKFIKDSSYKNIQKKFILLYSLDISDIIFTLLLLQTGLFREFNGIMAQVVEKPMFSLCLKVVLVGAFVFIICKRMVSATEKQLRISNVIISGAVAVYGIINLLHISYMFLYLSI